MRGWSTVVLVVSLTGCAQFPESRANHVTGEPGGERVRIEDPTVAALVLPLNLLPDLVSNYAVGLYPGNLWPIQYLLWPFSGLIWGVGDAVEGRPFWSPSAAYE
jgi:hypothetical protein